MNDVPSTWAVGSDETQLHGESVLPPDCSVAVLVVHGIGEHGGRYVSAMHHLAARGIGCYAYDQRGHGRSPGPRADIERFSMLVEDAVCIAKTIRRDNPERTLFMWGHSMGSVVTALAAGSLADELRGVVTSGCPIDVVSPAMHWAVPPLRAVARVIPKLRISGIFKAADLSHDPEVQREYEADPLVTHSVTLRLISAITTASDDVRAAAPGLTTPWLAVHGEEDQISPPSGSRHLVELLGSSDKQLIEYHGLRHEVHNEVEPSRSTVLDELARWMGGRSN